MLLAALSGPASPPVLGSLARLFAGENVPAGVEGNVQDGAAATTAALERSHQRTTQQRSPDPAHWCLLGALRPVRRHWLDWRNLLLGWNLQSF